MSVANTSKTSAIIAVNVSKNTASPNRYVKAGYGWNYDDPNITYDGVFDPLTGLPVLYDSEGTLPVFTNQTKNAA